MDVDFLRTRRKALGLTREELAKRAGVDAKTIQRCEQARTDGKSYRASKETLERIAEVLEVDALELTRSAVIEVERRLEQHFLAPLPPPEPWVGRAEEVQRIIEIISGDSPSPCCIAGPSGIGKTALAQLVAQRVARELPHGVIWLHASHQGRPVDIHEAQARIADGLGFRQRLPPAGAVDDQTRMRAFARELWAHQRLLILDDVVDAGLITHFLPADGKAAVLVTTHLMHVAERFGEDTIVLAGLPIDDTRQILSNHIGGRRVQADRHGVEELHDALGGVPRSIYIAARILQRERLVELGDYARRIRKDPAAGQYPSALRTQDTNLVASLAHVQEHVSAAAWTLLGALSLYDEAPFTPEWAAVAGAYAATDVVKGPLSELIDVYLVEYVSVGDAAKPWWFRLGAHVPVLARTIIGDRRAAAFEHVARHAVAAARTAGAWSDSLPERALRAHIANTLVAFVLDDEALRTWDGIAAYPQPILPSFAAECLVELVSLLLPELAHEVMSRIGVWLRGAIACARMLGRTGDEGRLLLALGRFRLRAHVDLPGAILCFDAATARLVEAGEMGLASAAASEAGRALLGCERPLEGLERFERAVAYARAAHLSGPELACRLNSAAVSFTRQPGTDGWKRAAAMLEEAVAACQDSEPTSRLFRVVCTLNLAAVRHALTADASHALDAAMSEWHALELDAPLLEARIWLLRALLARDPATAAELTAQARNIWHEQLHETPLADEDLLWLIGESAFHVRRYLAERDKDEELRVMARGFALSDISREIHVGSGDFVPIGLLFPVAPLESFFNTDFIAGARELATTVYGPGNRVSAELDAVEVLLGSAR